jgi:hypothetical protein
MSEGAAEGGGAPISGDQFGDVGDVTDTTPGETAQNPGDGVFAYGFYPWSVAQWGTNRPAARSRRTRRRTR